MNTQYITICILIMILVTYIPRALPILFFNKKIESCFIKDFLFYLPYAVLSALTFPSIFSCTKNVYISIMGSCVAVITAMFTKKVVIVALISVLVVYALSFIM